MKFAAIFTLFASFVAISFAEEDAENIINDADISIGEKSINENGHSIVPVVHTVDGVPTTIHFSVIDGSTVFVDEPIARDEYGGFIEQGTRNPAAFEAFLQRLLEGDVEEKAQEVASEIPEQESLSLAYVVKQVSSISSP